MRKDMKMAQPVVNLAYMKEGGPEVFADVYGALHWYWELQDQIPEDRRYVTDFQNRFGIPPGDYSTYSYSGILEAARGAELAKWTSADKVAEALRKSPVYDHYKGKQWWRACDNKSFQDMWIVRGRGPGQTNGDWGSMDIVTKIPASEELDRTCADMGQV
jgi:branched-chain amino acid transport system substrate-binding protein